MAVLALIPLEVERGRGRLSTRVVLETGGVARDALGVELVIAAVLLWGR